MGKNEHHPNTQEGKELMAHELTHTIQQNSREVSIQKAEVDESAVTRPLKDSSKKLNEYINKTIEEAYKFAEKEVNKNSEVFAFRFLHFIYFKLGKNKETGRTAIEIWARENLNVAMPEKDRTKYRGVNEKLWAELSQNTSGVKNKKRFRILNPVININGIYIGTDKLGHFFQQGYDYFKKYHFAIKKSGKTDKEAEKAAKIFGHDTEVGGFGLFSTGVLSHADLDANYAGFQFYKDLYFSVDKIQQFEIENKVQKSWNESNNSSEYSSSVAKIVWKNLFLDYEWEGTLEYFNEIKEIRFIVNIFENELLYASIFDKSQGIIIGEIKCKVIYVTNNYMFKIIPMEGVKGIKLINDETQVVSKNEKHLKGKWNNHKIELLRKRKLM